MNSDNSDIITNVLLVIIIYAYYKGSNKLWSKFVLKIEHNNYTSGFKNHINEFKKHTSEIQNNLQQKFSEYNNRIQSFNPALTQTVSQNNPTINPALTQTVSQNNPAYIQGAFPSIDKEKIRSGIGAINRGMKRTINRKFNRLPITEGVNSKFNPLSITKRMMDRSGGGANIKNTISNFTINPLYIILYWFGMGALMYLVSLIGSAIINYINNVNASSVSDNVHEYISQNYLIITYLMKIS